MKWAQRSFLSSSACGLLERLIINHESFDEIMASWDAQIARRTDDYDKGRTEGIPAEVVFAKMREIIRRAPKDS